MATVFVGGALANKYRNGGEAWVRLNWLLGLQRLGFKTIFVEQIRRETCVDAAGAVTKFEDCVNLAYFDEVVSRFGLSGSSALIYEDGERVHGLPRAELLDAASGADLLVNISGHVSWQPLMRLLRRKAYIDVDPGFTQLWHASGCAATRLQGHDLYFTVGGNIGTADCCIPTAGIRWRPMGRPVVLEQWPRSGASDPDRFTTVASWRGPYGPVHYNGRTFGLKVHQFRKFLELPERVPRTLEIALDIHPADFKDLESLRRHGWQIVDPRTAVPDPWKFRSYLQGAGAEFSVAQGIYVETASGWFSDRTACYLASGKPALVQETGFSRTYPAGEGLLTFRTLEEAAAAVERIAGDYDRHCHAARALAETCFDSDRVLGRFIEEVGVAP
ncbi:MAG: hypothetical protein HYX74_05320 [Acidobacteria bacterium]|nr:hypothetical protein [Acidobacteriota bacterium]